MLLLQQTIIREKRKIYMDEELFKIVNRLESIGKRIDRNIIIKEDIDALKNISTQISKIAESIEKKI